MVNGRGSVALLLDDSNTSSSSSSTTSTRHYYSRIIYRWWNQLSRLQRSLIYLILLFIIFILLLPGRRTYFQSHHEKTQEMPFNVQTTEESNSNIEVPEKLESGNDLNHKNLIDMLVKNQGDGKKPESEVEIVKSSNLDKKPMIFSGPANSRQEAIVDAFKHAWGSYKKYAWGHDHLRPISGSYHDWFSLALTLIDGMDTAYIMGLHQEFTEARNYVAHKISFDVSKDVNLFEVTIRVLGSLLSNYHLTGDSMFLDKAIDLGERLLPAFDTPSGIPFSDVNLGTRRAHSPRWSPDSSTSEVTTIQLEFRDLSRCSEDPRYENAVSKVSEHIHQLEKNHGLVPIFINPNSGQFLSYSTITLGARGDSYYEYLLKQWIQTGRTLKYLQEDYLEAIEGIQELLLRKTVPNNYVFLGELVSSTKTQKELKPKMDHLTCYLPGTLALGVYYGMPEWHMKLAEDLMRTCYRTYEMHPTFLAPEITYFNLQGEQGPDMHVKSNDAHNLLRPEFIESLWYMYRITKNTTYQEWGWQIFQAFEKYTRVTNGYTSIGTVKNAENTRPRDMMESFFLGETLKYLYLLFDGETSSINMSVFLFNSEAHLIPVRNS